MPSDSSISQGTAAMCLRCGGIYNQRPQGVKKSGGGSKSNKLTKSGGSNAACGPRTRKSGGQLTPCTPWLRGPVYNYHFTENSAAFHFCGTVQCISRLDIITDTSQREMY